MQEQLQKQVPFGDDNKKSNNNNSNSSGNGNGMVRCLGNGGLMHGFGGGGALAGAVLLEEEGEEDHDAGHPGEHAVTS